VVIRIRGAREHNLKSVNVDIQDGLTAVTGISGSGKSSLIFDTLYHEARRRFLEVYATGGPVSRLIPAAVDMITGLGPAVSVGQNLLNRNPASTLASASGLHPFLRLLFARFGDRICPVCGASYSVFGRDEIVQRIIRTIRCTAGEVEIPLLTGSIGSHSVVMRMLPAVLSGTGILYVDGRLAEYPLDPLLPHEFTFRLRRSEGEWDSQRARDLLDEAEAMGVYAVRLYEAGSWVRLGWKPECGSCGRWFPDIKPPDFHRACPICHGEGCDACHHSGLPADAAVVTWGGRSFKQFLQLSVEDCRNLIEHSEIPSARMRIEIERRLDALIQVGLGYLTLDRPAPTLSRGEAQRVRLATTITTRLYDLVHILDEPTVGLHPFDVERLVPAFRELNGQVIFVEHDRSAVADADEVIDIGPAAGDGGGMLIYQGSPAGLWQADTPSGQWFSLRRGQVPRKMRSEPKQFLTITAATANNLQNIDVSIPLGRMTVVTGVSGSGKSTLVEDVLAASLRDKKPRGCEKLSVWLECEMVDQSPIGKNPRSNPATYTKLADIIRGLFAAKSGLSPSHFSFNRPEGACPSCEGLGAIEVAMRYLPSTWIRCEACDGRRFNDTVLAHSIQLGESIYSVADFYDLPIGDIRSIIRTAEGLEIKDREAALRILDALCRIGLDYLPLGQPSTTLSGGEAQRVKLARYLGLKSLSGKILILDEPSTGLHAQDLAGLLDVFYRLTEAGATLVVVEHHLDVIRAADWVIDLGPEAGSKGGKLVFIGPADQLATAAGSVTGAALRREAELKPRATRHKPRGGSVGASISIRGARANNLRNIDVDIPKGKLTVVTGVSGSGKSSLVSDILEGEARRRYYETLSMYERQGVHEGREAEVDLVTGLGVTLRATPEKLTYSRRATVGSLTEVSHHLAILLALKGERTCLGCDKQMTRLQDRWLCPGCGTSARLSPASHFLGNTYASACPACHGVGSFQQPNPAKLIIAPEKPLCAGAMYSPGFFPNGYLGKPGNGGYYLVQALGRRYSFDPHHTPWNELSDEAKKVFLFGSDEELDIHGTSKSGRTIDHRARFPGFYRFVGDWDVGNTYTDNVSCPECGGARLRREYLAVRLAGLHIAEMNQLGLRELWERLLKMAPHLGEDKTQFSYQAVIKRLDFLYRVGLGYLSIARPAGTLSAGEVQRLRLAGMLGSQLTSLTILLDEPTRGLHPDEVGALQAVLHNLSEAGNTVVVSNMMKQSSAARIT
jgi:excinuclease ABC subunit A